MNYAVALLKLDRRKEAESILEEVMERRVALLGLNHPDSLKVKTNYAIQLES